MKHFAFAALIMSVIFVSACSRQAGQTAGGKDAVAKVGSVTITKADLSRELKNLPPQIQAMFEGPQGTEKFLDEIVKKEMLYQEAKKKGLEKDEEFKRKVEDFKKLTLISVLLEKEIEEKAKVTEKDVKDYYEAHKAEFMENAQVRASHILVKSEEEAKNISEALKKGADFAKLAKEKSIDTGSAKNGGDLGFFSKGQMVPEFEKAAFSLKKGEVSQPVKTQFGYHIIKVTEKKEGTPLEFERVKDRLMQKLTAEKQKEMFDSYVNNLKGTYKPEINKEALSGMEKKTPVESEKPAGEKK